MAYEQLDNVKVTGVGGHHQWRLLVSTGSQLAVYVSTVTQQHLYYVLDKNTASLAKRSVISQMQRHQQITQFLISFIIHDFTRVPYDRFPLRYARAHSCSAIGSAASTRAG